MSIEDLKNLIREAAEDLRRGNAASAQYCLRQIHNLKTPQSLWLEILELAKNIEEAIEEKEAGDSRNPSHSLEDAKTCCPCW